MSTGRWMGSSWLSETRKHDLSTGRTSDHGSRSVMARFVSVRIAGFSKSWINPDHVMGVSVLEDESGTSIALLMSTGEITVVDEEDAGALVDSLRGRQ